MVLRILDRSFRASIDDSALLHSSTSPLLLRFEEEASTSPLLPSTMGKKEDSDYDSYSLSKGKEQVYNLVTMHYWGKGDVGEAQCGRRA